MKLHPFTIVEKEMPLPDTAVVRLHPVEGTRWQFKPGQYCYIVNPLFSIPDEAHPFSIASSPLTPDSIEFCIRAYGDWTEDFLELPRGSTLLVSNPTGNFVWENPPGYAVFLVGGVGISPLMSMLRTNALSSSPSVITLLYGNRTPETVLYAKEIAAYERQFPWLSVVHIYSHVTDAHPWKGYRGFITADIVEKEVDFMKKPTFFVVGPPVFIEKMTALLTRAGISPASIRFERLEEKQL